MKHLSKILAVILLAVFLPACSSDNNGTEPEESSAINATVVSVSPSESTTPAGAVIPFSSDASKFEYRYDQIEGNLHVRHTDAAFLEGGGEISVRVNVEENIITLIEKQRGATSNDLTLYDLDYVVSNLPLRVYRVVVIEPYLKKDERPLSFRMDLVASLEGSVSVVRDQAPWAGMAAL
ncbi:MAG: hypothetical protein WAV84_08200 [Bacteroidota bacterium]